MRIMSCSDLGDDWINWPFHRNWCCTFAMQITGDDNPHFSAGFAYCSGLEFFERLR